MARVTKAAIFAAPLVQKEITVPQWDGEVLIGEFPVEQRQTLLKSIMGPDGSVRVSAEIELQVFLAGMVDPEFTPEDGAQMQKVSGAAVSFVAQQIMALNGMTAEAADNARGES